MRSGHWVKEKFLQLFPARHGTGGGSRGFVAIPPAPRPRTLRHPRAGSPFPTPALPPKRRRDHAGRAPGPLGPARGPGRAGGTGCPPVPSPARQVSVNCTAGRPRAAAGPEPAPSAASPQTPPIFALRKAVEPGGLSTAWGHRGHRATHPCPGPRPYLRGTGERSIPGRAHPSSQRCRRRGAAGEARGRPRSGSRLPAEPAGLAERPRRVAPLRSAPPPGRLPEAAPAAVRARAGGGGGEGRGTRLPETASLPALSASGKGAFRLPGAAPQPTGTPARSSASPSAPGTLAS